MRISCDICDKDFTAQNDNELLCAECLKAREEPTILDEE